MSNQLKFTGILHEIHEVKTGTTKGGDQWKSVDFFVEETGAEYPQSAVFRLFGVEKVNKFIKYNDVGTELEVSFNLKTNEHENKRYNSLDAWSVKNLNYKKEDNTETQKETTSQQNNTGGGSYKKEEVPTATIDDDLPFNRKRFYSKYSIGK